METPQDTQNDSYSHTRHTKRQLQLHSQLLVRPIYLWDGCVPRLTFNKDMAPDRGLTSIVCMYVRMYAG
jgi:hypothetical protein